MDVQLRRYLEQPAPRPPFKHRHDDRRQLWLFPLGAAITFAMIFGSVFANDRALLGLALWAGAVCTAGLLGWSSHIAAQAVYRNGTFTEGRVVSTQVEIGSEDQTLVVTFRARLAGTGTGYRDAGERDALYRSELNDRWIVEPNYVPFLNDAAFPMLLTPDRKHAKLYVNDEEIDASPV